MHAFARCVLMLTLTSPKMFLITSVTINLLHKATSREETLPTSRNQYPSMSVPWSQLRHILPLLKCLQWISVHQMTILSVTLLRPLRLEKTCMMH